MAAHLEIDAVIDPADTRNWIMEGLKAVPAGGTARTGHDFVDPW
jgi:acetyl-CoA carboxylase carboxyltransferase component